MGDAADFALQTVAAATTSVEEVRFVLFTDDALAHFRRALDELEP